MSVIINGTTGVSGVDGSASAPAIQGNDTNTGIFFPAADTIAFAEGGSEIARFDSSGNLGIGTSSPTTRIDVFGTGSVLGRFVRNNTGGASGGIRFGNNSGTFTAYADTTLQIYDDQASLERLRIESNGNLLFNSGYGSVATAYGCRAWVNFNGTANSNQSATYSQSGTTVTVTATAHGLTTGNLVYLDITSGTAVDGAYSVTVTDANTFTVQQASRTTSGNVTIVKSTIRSSGNVSSVADIGTGLYGVSFSTVMPDSNYAAVATSKSTGGTTGFIAGLSNATDALSAGYVRVTTVNNSLAAADSETVCVSIFR